MNGSAKKLLWGLGALAVLALIAWRLGPMVRAIFWAAFLAYLLWPPYRWLSRRTGRAVAAGLVFGGIALLIVLAPTLLLPLLIRDVEGILQNIPLIIGQLDDTLGRVNAWFSSSFAVEPLSMDPMAQQLSEWVQQRLLNVRTVSALPDRLIWLLVIPFLCFYLLRDQDQVLRLVRYLIPERWRADVFLVGRYCGALIQRYLRGQLLVSVIVGALTGVGLTVFHVRYAVLLGFFAGVCNMIPYIGFILSALPVLLIAMTGGMDMVLRSAAVMIVVQQLESLVISPRIVGDSLGVHPVLILLSVLAGGALGGISGFFLAVPALIVIKGVLTSLQQRWLWQKRLKDDCILHEP